MLRLPPTHFTDGVAFPCSGGDSGMNRGLTLAKRSIASSNGMSSIRRSSLGLVMSHQTLIRKSAIAVHQQGQETCAVIFGAVIIPQTELVQIPLQVLLADLVVDTVHATLETGEKPLYCHREGVANDITTADMVDAPMEIESVQPFVAGVLIGVDLGSLCDIGFNQILKSLLLGIRHVEGSDTALDRSTIATAICFPTVPRPPRRSRWALCMFLALPPT